ncbi:MAG: hypothetical protein PHG85_00005 [Candidatus Altiarchaeota archaeon]|nr:hypothetical protein [Candidatus Altiarchaeota archaeon]
MKNMLGNLLVLAFLCGCLASPSVKTSITTATSTTLHDITTLPATTTAYATTIPTTTLIQVRTTGPFQIIAYYNTTTGDAVLQVEGELDRQYSVVVDYDVYHTMPLPEMGPDFQGEKIHLARLQASQPSYISSKTTPGPSDMIAKDSRAQICITTNLTTLKGGTTSFSTSQDCRFIGFQYIPKA